MTERVFVSSTLRDLARHRAHAIAELRRAGAVVEAMEEWPAEGEQPVELSTTRVAGCDLLVLLVGLERGSMSPAHDESIVQREYRQALESGVDVIVFLADETRSWPGRDQGVPLDPAHEDWRRSLSSTQVVEPFGPEPGSLQVLPSLVRWQRRRQRATQGPLILSGQVAGGHRIPMTGEREQWAELARWPTAEELESGDSDRYARFPVRFDHPFAQPPQLLLALRAIDTNARHLERKDGSVETLERVHVWPEEVRADGFRLVVKVWSTVILNYVEVEWLAHGQPAR